jgi:hypothetical protein
MPLDVPTIVEGLRFLREADCRRVVFGADSHRYQLRPCIDQSKIVDFERQYSVRLPNDYRDFLMYVGNGGAGPYYGILGLDQLYETSAEYWNDLSKPFPYSGRWEGPPDLLKAIKQMDVNEMPDDDRRGELNDQYWSEASRDGSIAICEYGCNLRFLIIVNGAEFGHIWFDATPDLAGYSPVGINPAASLEQYGKWCITNQNTPEERRVGFGEWYHCWLDWASRLVKAGK